MKKNYLFPVTGETKIENCFAICAGSEEHTPMDGPSIPGGSGFEAPKRQV